MLPPDSNLGHPASSAPEPSPTPWAEFDSLMATLPNSLYFYSVVRQPSGEEGFTYLSTHATAIHELGLEEMLQDAEKVFSQCHPDDQASYLKAAETSRQNLTQFDHQWRIITPSGQIKWLHGSSRPQAQPDGSIIWHGMIQEITAWKRTEEKLRAAEQNLQAAQRIAHLGSWTFNHQTQAMEWSPETCNIFDQDLELCATHCQASFEKFYEIIHPYDRSFFQALFEQHLQTQAPTTIEHRLLLADGLVKYVKQEWESEFAADGTPLMTQGIIQDITEKHDIELDQARATAQIQALNQELERRIEERTTELAKREAYLRGVLEGAIDPILMTNLDGAILHVNPAACELLDYTEAELRQLTVKQIHPAAELSRVIESFRDLRTKKKSRVLDIQIQTKAGELIPVDIAASLIELEDETIVLGIFRDLRPYKVAVAALQESETNYRQLFETANEGIWILDQEGRTRAANEALVRMLGTNLAAIIGTLGEEWFPPEHQAQFHIYWQRLQAGFCDQYEIPMCSADGQFRQVLVSASPIIGPDGEFQGSLAMLTDITERKATELENQLLRQRLEFLISTSPAITYSCHTDDDYAMTFITENCAKILGYGPAEFIDNPRFWLDHIHPDDREPVLQAHQQHLQEQGWLKTEYRFQHQQGHYLWLQDEMQLVRDTSGNAMEIVGFLADITDRKATEAQLEQLTRHLTNAQRIAKVGSWEFDLATQEITWSEEVFRIFGYDRSDTTPTYPELLAVVNQRRVGKVRSCLHVQGRGVNCALCAAVFLPRLFCQIQLK